MNDGHDGSARSEPDRDHAEGVHTQRDTTLARAAERYARGELTPSEKAQHVAHLGACEVCRDLEDEASRLDSTIVSYLEPVEPRADLWALVESRIASDDARASNEPHVQPWKSWTEGPPSASNGAGFALLTADDGAFEPSGRPGISTRRLSVDRANRRVSMLVRMEAGASYPPHRHGGPEECFVVSGDLHVGSPDSPADAVHMLAGDFQRAEAGSVHPVQYTNSGCLLLIMSSVDDDLLEV